MYFCLKLEKNNWFLGGCENRRHFWPPNLPKMRYLVVHCCVATSRRCYASLWQARETAGELTEVKEKRAGNIYSVLKMKSPPLRAFLPTSVCRPPLPVLLFSVHATRLAQWPPFPSVLIFSVCTWVCALRHRYGTTSPPTGGKM